MAKTNKSADEGVTVEITGKTGERRILISLPVDEALPLSGSGKTLAVASTHGNIQTEVQVNGKPVYVGVNAYIYAKDKA